VFPTFMLLRTLTSHVVVPAEERVDGAHFLFFAAFFLTLGFFTDTIGFLCLIPSLRRAVIRWAFGRFLIPPGFGGQGPGPGAGDNSSQHQGPRTLEGEYRREDD